MAHFHFVSPKIELSYLKSGSVKFAWNKQHGNSVLHGAGHSAASLEMIDGRQIFTGEYAHLRLIWSAAQGGTKALTRPLALASSQKGWLTRTGGQAITRCSSTSSLASSQQPALQCDMQEKESISPVEAGPSGEASSSRQASNQQASTSGSAGSGPEYWQDLLGVPEADELFGTRARSASDAGVLRRKGHLKEQDQMIEFMLRMHETHTSLEVMQKMEKWISEHQKDPRRSRLRRMVPAVGSFFTPIRLVDAFLEYDEFFALSRRRYVPPNFAELRHVLNIAQVHASVHGLKLITFDADGTLYADGAHMMHDNEMIHHIYTLLQKDEVHVAIVTAAGYPGEAHRFEERVAGLLQFFKRRRLPQSVTDRFHIVGGECNYLLRINRDYRLEFVDDSRWMSEFMQSWSQEDVKHVLDEAATVLLDTAKHLRLPVKLVRKERAVGVVPQAPTVYEVLEEIVITVQSQLVDVPLPFCAFNGGGDVFVDCGNKSLGLEALMDYLGFKPHQVLHVGDRFTQSGNDSAVRDCCSILWVANPEETDFFIKLLLQDLRSLRQQPYIE